MMMMMMMLMLMLLMLMPQVSDKVTLEGPLAAALRRAAYLYRQPTNEQRISVATSWVAQAAEVAPKILQQILNPPRRN